MKTLTVLAAAALGLAAAPALAQKPDAPDPRDWIEADDLNAMEAAAVAERAADQRIAFESAAAERARYEAEMASFRRMNAIAGSGRAATEAGNTERACELYRSAMAIDPALAQSRFQATLDWIETYC